MGCTGDSPSRGLQCLSTLLEFVQQTKPRISVGRDPSPISMDNFIMNIHTWKTQDWKPVLAELPEYHISLPQP